MIYKIYTFQYEEVDQLFWVIDREKLDKEILIVKKIQWDREA